MGCFRTQHTRFVEASEARHQRFPSPVWQSEALFGATPEEAFYVSVTRKPIPLRLWMRELIIEIGMCPVKPAEFVVFESDRCLLAEM